MYIYIYIHKHISLYIYIYIHIHTYTYMYIHICVIPIIVYHLYQITVPRRSAVPLRDRLQDFRPKLEKQESGNSGVRFRADSYLSRGEFPPRPGAESRTVLPRESKKQNISILVVYSHE